MQESPKQPPFSKKDKPVFPSTSPPNESQGAPASKSRGGSPLPNIPIESDALEQSKPALPPQREPTQPPVAPPPVPQQTTPPQPNHVRPQPQPYRPEQKRTLLNRGEVRTMHKDMVRTREARQQKAPSSKR